MTLFPFLAFVGMASVMDDWLDVLPYLCLLVLFYIIVGHSFVRKFLVSHAQKTRVEPWLLDERRLEGFDKEQMRLLREVAHECEQEIAFMSDVDSHYPGYATLNPIGNGPSSLGPFLRLKEACTPEMIPILEHFLQHLPESVT